MLVLSRRLSASREARATTDCAATTDADALLIARCKAGERAAFHALLHLYRDRVVNLAHSLLHSRDDAEDAAQDVFAAAFTSLHTFRGDSQFWSWLYRITVNECLGRKRRARKHENLDAHEFAARDACETVVQKLAVENALDTLSAPLRAVLVLREMHDLSYEEIAATLQIPVGTVRSRLSEARRWFKIAWAAAEAQS